MIVAGICPSHGFWQGDSCPKCKAVGGGNFPAIKNFEPYYHVGLGEMVYNTKDYQRKLNKAGCVEVGTEKIQSAKNKGIPAKEWRNVQAEMLGTKRK